MLKFQFNHLNQTLAYQAPFSETWQELTETFAGNFGSLGFQLPDGWITFSIYASKTRAFYKQTSSPVDPDDFWVPVAFTYYRKDLPKQAPVIFTFTEADQVEKVAGRWVNKGEPTM